MNPVFITSSSPFVKDGEPNVDPMRVAQAQYLEHLMEQIDPRPDLHLEQLLMENSVTLPEGEELNHEELKAKAGRMFMNVEELRIEEHPSAIKVHGGYRTVLYRVFGRYSK